MLSSPAPTCSAEDFLFAPISLQKFCTYKMKAGRSYAVKLIAHSWKTAVASDEPSPHATKLCFQEYVSDDAAIDAAVAVAKESDISIIFAGRNPEHESEGF